MNYLLGTKQDFEKFLESISKEDNVAIITHTDLDGIASCIFLEEILNSQKIKVKKILFKSYSKGMFKEQTKILKQRKITKVFLTDISADASDPEGYETFQKQFKCFLLDHHPIDQELKDKKNIIKTETKDCAALLIYDLAQDYLNLNNFNWLLYSAMIADWSFRKKENLEFLQKADPLLTEEKIFESEYGKIGNTINAALIYYKKDLKKVYNLTKEKNLKELKKVEAEIEKEIQSQVKQAKEKAEYVSKRDIYFYHIDSKYQIASTVATILSMQKGIWFVIKDGENGYSHISARNNTTEEPINLLIKKAIKGLENATGGGHKRASAAKIRKKDLNKFKENLLA